MEVAIGFLLGIIGSLFVVPLFADNVNRLLVRLFGSKVPKKQQIAGKWSQRWWTDVQKSDRDKTGSQDAEIKQLRNRITGTFPSIGRTYRLEGTIARDTFITGTWRDDVEGVTYHGAFQLIIGQNAETMRGRWVGFSGKEYVVNSSDWEWKRPALQKISIRMGERVRSYNKILIRNSKICLLSYHLINLFSPYFSKNRRCKFK